MIKNSKIKQFNEPTWIIILVGFLFTFVVNDLGADWYCIKHIWNFLWK